jgi:REP element-mobilizing transposase RayT
VHVPGGVYHVTLRGNHRQAIFHRDADRERLNEIVADVADRLELRVHAYCWMSNHIHLALQVAERPLGDAMRCIASRHARAVQRDLATSGHLFERRYRPSLVDTDAYLLDVVRYIHLNPVAAKLVADPADYPWSSHRAYLGLASTPWLTCELVLGALTGGRGRAREARGSALRRCRAGLRPRPR